MYRLRLTFINMSAACTPKGNTYLPFLQVSVYTGSGKKNLFWNDACTKANSIQPDPMEAYGEKGRTHTRYCSNPGKE